MQAREPHAGAGLVAALVRSGSTPFRFRPALARLVGLRPSEVQAIARPGRFGAAPAALPPRRRALAAMAPASIPPAGSPAEPAPSGPASPAASVRADDAHLPSSTHRLHPAEPASGGRTFDLRVPAGVASAARPALAAPTPAPLRAPARPPADAPAALPLPSAAHRAPSAADRAPSTADRAPSTVLRMPAPMPAPVSGPPSADVRPPSTDVRLPPPSTATAPPPWPARATAPRETPPAPSEPAPPVIDLRAALARHVTEHLAPRIGAAATTLPAPAAPATLPVPPTPPAPPTPPLHARIDAAAHRPPALTVADLSAPGSAASAPRIDLDALHARHGTSPLTTLSQRPAADPRLQNQIAELTRELTALRQGARDAADASARIATAAPAALAAARRPSAPPPQPPSDASWARRRTGPMRFRVSR